MSTSSEIPESLWQINKGPELIGIATPMVVFSTLVVAVRIVMTVRRRKGLGYDSWLILVSLVRVQSIYEYSRCERIDSKLTYRPLKLLLWGTYIMDVLLVNLGGLGRPLVVNLAIDKSRLTILMKVTPPHSFAASQ